MLFFMELKFYKKFFMKLEFVKLELYDKLQFKKNNKFLFISQMTVGPYLFFQISYLAIFFFNLLLGRFGLIKIVTINEPALSTNFLSYRHIQQFGKYKTSVLKAFFSPPL